MKDKKLEKLLKLIAQGSDLNEADLSGMDFSGENLRGADFSGARLVGCDFRNANCSCANFESCDLTGSNFEGTDVRYANFNEAKIGSTIFENKDLFKVTKIHQEPLEGGKVAKSKKKPAKQPT